MKKIMIVLFAIAVLVGTSSCVLLTTGTVEFNNFDGVVYDCYIDATWVGAVGALGWLFVDYVDPGTYRLSVDRLGVEQDFTWANVFAGQTTEWQIDL